MVENVESLRETTAELIRILTIAGDSSRSQKEQVDLISGMNGPLLLDISMRPLRWPWQRIAAQEAMNATSFAALKAVNLRLQAAMLTSEHLIARLRAVTGKSREQILQDLAINIDAILAEYSETDQ